MSSQPNLERLHSLLDRGGLSPERIRRAAVLGVAVYGRVSTAAQAIGSVGSQLAQRDHWRSYLEALGVPATITSVLEAWGESGSGVKPRAMFQRLLQLLNDGRVGLIIVPEHHRLSRNTIDTHRILNAAAQAGALIMIGGRAYDPSNPNDLLVLQILSAVAQHDVSSSSDWSLKGRIALARRAALRFSLPSGLVWASPKDPEYVTRLKDAGLYHWIDGIRSIPPDRRAVTHRDGVAYFVLPYPDSAIARSVELRLQWLIETRSVSAVRARIVQGHEGWPAARAGTVPSIRLSRYRPDVAPSWQPVKTTHLTRWFENPALYGIYVFYAERLAPPEMRAARRRRKNGAHYGRATAEHAPALPDASELL